MHLLDADLPMPRGALFTSEYTNLMHLLDAALPMPRGALFTREYTNLMHLLYTALPMPRGALFTREYTYAHLRCRTSQDHRTFIPCLSISI